MDLTDPTRAVTATLDGPILAVLARAGRPLTVSDVAKQTPRGSEVGVRRSLARLVDQGIVRATEMGRNRVHELNWEHVAAPIAEALAGIRLVLWQRLREKLASWNPKPVYGCVFGSAARGTGDATSDIDLLLVRTRAAGEALPKRSSATVLDALGLVTSELVAPPLTEQQAARWEQQVSQLHDQVRAWTGNPLQVVEMSVHQWRQHQARRTPLFAEIDRDRIQVAGVSDWPSPAAAGSR